MSLPFEAAVAQLMQMGWSRDTAEREVRRQLSTWGDVAPPSQRIAVAVERVQLPFSIVLPWSTLVSDDDRAIPVVENGGTRARLVLTERYRTARDTIRALVRAKLGGGPNSPATLAPVAQPIELVGRVWVPDNRVHDVPNFAKGVHDAMARQVYTNDAWIYRAVWIRAGVDVDHPRAEITITPLTP